MAKFTTRKGALNGVYLVTDWKPHGTHYFVTLKCTVCGHEVTRTSTGLRQIADKMRECCCARFQNPKGKSKAGIRKDASASLYSKLKRNFGTVLRRKLKVNPNLPHDDFDTIWKAVGPMPPETDLYTWELGIKGHGNGKPDMTADNYEWRKRLKPKAINQVHADSNKSREHLKRALRKRNTLAEVTNEELMQNRVKSYVDEYEHFVGKRFGRVKVVHLRKDEYGLNKYGFKNVIYYFTVECRCGCRFERQALKFYKGNVRCPNCQKDIKKSISRTKNSSTQCDSKLMRLRMMKDARARIKGNKGIDIDSLMMLRESHSWYSLCFGTEDTMNFFIDCDLAGKGEEIRQIYWRG